MQRNNSQVAPKGAGAVGGARQQNPPILRSLEELVKSEWYKEEAEVVLKYIDVVKQAIINAVKKARSCVLRYEYIHDEIYNLIEDEDEAWRVENAVYSVLSYVKIGDIAVYKIYVDPDESTFDMLAVVIGEELSQEQLRILEEVASLIDTKFYDKYDEREGAFYDATPINAWERTEVYTVLHNLVNIWTNCRSVIEELEEDEGEKP
jgi:hypothetical protein